MKAKKLLKKHLDIHTPKGEYRSEKQLIQLRDDASIGAINEALTIHSVSQQRELLVDFWMDLPNTNKNKGVAKYYVDKYLESTNCG